MVERIREILSRYQLTPTQFADAIGTARPIVSHILSGRNKPSLEVIQKIIAAYPELSLPWLLSGTGPIDATVVAPSAGPQQAMARPKDTETPAAARTATKQPSTTPEALQASVAAPAPTERASAPDDQPAPPSNQPAEQTAPVPAAPARLVTEPAASVTPVAELPKASLATSAPASASSALQAFAEPGKAIRRIVIFYSDGTFTDYQPETSLS